MENKEKLAEEIIMEMQSQNAKRGNLADIDFSKPPHIEWDDLSKALQQMYDKGFSNGLERAAKFANSWENSGELAEEIKKLKDD